MIKKFSVSETNWVPCVWEAGERCSNSAHRRCWLIAFWTVVFPKFIVVRHDMKIYQKMKIFLKYWFLRRVALPPPLTNDLDTIAVSIFMVNVGRSWSDRAPRRHFLNNKNKLFIQVLVFRTVVELILIK